jgi:plastocyanin
MSGVPRTVDNDGDGYEDPEPAPMPDSGQGSPTAPDPTQVPVVLTVNIVGTSGTGAFAPNPLQASLGNAIVWRNNDVIAHEIVLGNGTIVGSLAPGQSSAPVVLASATATYRCTIHPSMTGQITNPTAPPAPGDPSQAPAPDPYANPAPADPYADPYDYAY